MALTRLVESLGLERILRRMRQFFSWELARSPMARMRAWAVLAAF